MDPIHPIILTVVLVVLGFIFEDEGFIGFVLWLAWIVLGSAFLVMGGTHVLVGAFSGLVICVALLTMMEESAKRGVKEIFLDKINQLRIVMANPIDRFALVVGVALCALFTYVLVSVSNGWDMLTGTAVGAGAAYWLFMRSRPKPKRQPASDIEKSKEDVSLDGTDPS